jgi:hypothetical protein
MGEENNNRIELKDNSDQAMSQSETQENKENAAPQQEGMIQEPATYICDTDPLCLGGSWYEKPENLGNSFGGKVEETLSPVGKHAGPVLGAAGKPIGGLVEPLVGGIMKGGKAWGEQVGVGYGNAEGGPAKQQEAEGQRMKEPFGGKEQNADNPLGL